MLCFKFIYVVLHFFLDLFLDFDFFLFFLDFFLYLFDLVSRFLERVHNLVLWDMFGRFFKGVTVGDVHVVIDEYFAFTKLPF